MSTRTYNLRARADAAVASQSQVQNAENPQLSTTSSTRDLPSHVVGSRPFSRHSPALYSDVVASRSPSPVGGGTPIAVENPEVGVTSEKVVTEGLVPEVRTIPVVLNKNIPSFETETSSGENDSPEDPGEAPWTTVQRRRARSLDSFEPVRKPPSGSDRTKDLSADQVQTVRAAAETLTKSQKETIEERQKKVTRRRKNSSSSRESPSKNKGKGIDPREWGNVNIS